MDFFRKLFGGGSRTAREYLEQRKQQRARVKESLLCVLDNEGTVPVFVSDVSLTGLRIRSRSKLIKGQEVTFLAEEKERKIIGATSSQAADVGTFRFAGRVLWVRRDPSQNEFSAGIVLPEPVNRPRDQWLRLAMKSAGINSTRERRRHFRVPTETPFTFHTASGYEGQGRLLDIGLAGLRGVVAFDLPVGADVALEIPAQFSAPAVKNLDGKVARQKKKGTGEWEVALSFGELSPQRKSDLGRFIDYLLSR